jgi:S-adenosylmethionine:tRNA ribosyltransferase-isomerase
MHPKHISIEDYNYPLPEDKIAQFPVKQRDKSKLLISNNGNIEESIFDRLTDFIPSNSLMVFNNTKVIRARMQFKKATGAKIEIFILEPLSPTKEIQNAFQVKGECEWICLVGNAKKWKEGNLSLSLEHQGKEFVLNAEKIEAIGSSFRIRFYWEPAHLTFSDILMANGSIPLPPYMKRDTTKEDVERYQTIYAEHQGSVAAPTAGLHFTDKVMAKLSENNITEAFVSLHVGAGTFKPVSSEKIEDHEMHIEQVVIHKKLVKQLIDFQNKKIIAVGTTTTRTLESLYWFGLRIIKNKDVSFHIKQWEPYENEDSNISTIESLNAILNYMNENNLEEIHGDTQIIIAPSYKFKVIDILITNFHQPKSTLLLLVSAFYGENWRKTYKYALENNFRFLSYGDSCVFFGK